MGNATSASNCHGGTACAQRELLNVLDNWGVHFFTSSVTPQGAVTTDDFIAFWTTLHNFSDPTFAWDAWMAQSMTFYSPMLTPFLSTWESNDVSWLGRYYTNAIDNATLYSAFVSVPHAGVVIEIVSPSVSTKYQADFDLFHEISCPESLYVNRSTSSMHRRFVCRAKTSQRLTTASWKT